MECGLEQRKGLSINVSYQLSQGFENGFLAEFMIHYMSSYFLNESVSSLIDYTITFINSDF